ncbi:MAG: AAA family ATPase [Candidatus Dependentiae bacterium]|nr:AAA family ATPase [Candidatus Dependentiae bacterium]
MYFLYLFLFLSYTFNAIAITEQQPYMPHSTPNEQDPYVKTFWADYEERFNNQKPTTIKQPSNESNKHRPIDDKLIDIIFEINPELNEIVESHELAKKRGNPALKLTAILFVGDPGLGKSLAARAIAKKLNAGLTFIQASKLGTELQNSAASNLGRYLDAAEQAEGEHVVVIDELHCLIDNKKQEYRNDIDPATRLHQKMDEDSDLIYIGTANDIKNIPGPLQTRFRDHKIQFSKLDSTARRKIFDFYAGTHITQELLDYATKQTNNMSIRDLEKIVNFALLNAARRDCDNISKEDFDSALQKMQKIIALEKESWPDWGKRWGKNILVHAGSAAIAAIGGAVGIRITGSNNPPNN